MQCQARVWSNPAARFTQCANNAYKSVIDHGNKTHYCRKHYREYWKEGHFGTTNRYEVKSTK